MIRLKQADKKRDERKQWQQRTIIYMAGLQMLHKIYPGKTMEYKAIAFTGPSESGKTTLIEKIALRLINDRKIAIIKNDPSDKAVFDRDGKDSDRFFKTGAEKARLYQLIVPAFTLSKTIKIVY